MKWQVLIGLAVGMSLAACGRDEVALIPPPPATDAQVAREARYLQEHFRTDRCFAGLIESQASVELPSEKGEPAYSVPLPAAELVNDQFHYVVEVRKSDRMGYLVRSGGLGGVHESVGPMSLVPCLQAVFKPQAQQSNSGAGVVIHAMARAWFEDGLPMHGRPS